MPKPLTIGIDLRDMRVAKTGTKTYLNELCLAFKQVQDPDVRFCFIDTWLPVFTGNNKFLKLLQHVRYQLWKQLILPVKAWIKGCDIVFCTDNMVPLWRLGFQTVPVFHDAFFFEMPENYGKLWLWLYLKTAVPAARKSAFVVTPSAYAKKQINHFTGIPNNQLVVVYEGSKTWHQHDSINHVHVLEKFGLMPKLYLLHVGSLFKRKNLPALVQAFSYIKKQGHPELKLVLAGQIPSVATENDYGQILKTVEDNGLSRDVIITGYLSDAELSALYENALIYVFPSVNEGFGIPVLEAFKHQLPVLVANNSSLPEVGGDAVVTFNPFDIEDIASSVLSVLDDVGLQQTLKRRGLQRLEQFSWQKAARQIIQVFKLAAAKK